DALWQRLVTALAEPELHAVPDANERFHAWFDPGGDGKPPAIWTKPLQGAKQVRLPHRREAFRTVYDFVEQGDFAKQGGATPACDLVAACREITLRGHYLYSLMRAHGWEPAPRG